ncbi:hypothetical protein BJ973_000081 [Actinoplanes tereljensis]|uniref:Uncharacterized protein n=1 Tax=Paractinoplanes tereljensis TaxID=571912 RepID=A0A919U0F4_9ACTN|nr:hypothetical protein [Actinoplanes tereljensis]GIF26827.1 hypothetical protein Ate02nite_95570 [Actinoplanes tereljensis]
MDAIFAEYRDKDKNFIKDFQQTGFSARVWELSLFAFLRDCDLDLDESYRYPDYVVTRPHEFALEAVTSQPTQGVVADPKPSALSLVPEDVEAGQKELVFRVGDAIQKKINKRTATGQAYWELDHVAGKPFVIAVEAFHSASSLFHAVTFVSQYLYGQQAVGTRGTDGRLAVSAKPITEHVWGKKSKPSGLFNSPDAENVSAILFSNGATVAQFNRIGIQEGFGLDDEIVVLRQGTCMDYDPDASEPVTFAYIVGDPNSPYEDFKQVMNVMYNPNAKIPLPEGAFPGVAEHHFEADGRVSVTCQGFHPFASVTQIFTGRKAAKIRAQLT